MELPAQQICLSMGIPKGIEGLAPLLSPCFIFCARDIVGDPVEGKCEEFFGNSKEKQRKKRREKNIPRKSKAVSTKPLEHRKDSQAEPGWPHLKLGLDPSTG